MQNEVIKLSLPINAAYVSAARLTASSIANRLNFNIDEIEDIKAAVSEACTFIIKSTHSSKAEGFKILFSLEKDMVKTTISVDFEIDFREGEEEMGLLMIRALMDEFTVSSDTATGCELCMVKYHRGTLFN